MRTRFFVDVTSTYFQGASGGIPRIVRKYVEALGQDDDIALICFVYAGNNFYAVPRTSLAAPHRFAHALRRLRARLGIRNRPRLPLYDMALSVWEAICAVQFFVLALAGRVTRIPCFDRGDVILLPYVPRRASFPAQMRRRNRGAFTVAMISDLFPLEYPGQFFPELRSIFERGLAVQAGLADLIVCISQATAGRVRDYLAARGIYRPVSFVYLGSDVEDWRDHARAGESGREPPQVPAILSVGTLEPRKNYAYALALCDRLWGAGLDFRYVIVGGIDSFWLDIARMVRAHPEHGRRLLHRPNAGDLELLELYRTSSCLLAVSIDEGFGLPVVEARHCALPVICSDIAIFRELHPAATFIALDDPASASAMIGALLDDPGSAFRAAEENAASGVLISWRESAARLRRTIAEHRSASGRSAASASELSA